MWLAAAGAVQAQEVSVTGLAVEVTGQDERLLVRADGPLVFEVAEPNPSLVLLTLRGVGIADHVPRRLSGAPGANLQRIVALETTGSQGAGLRLQISHAAGKRPLIQLTDEGAEIVFARAPSRSPRAAARGATSGPEPRISLAMNKAPLGDLIRKVATQTGETILMESQISKQISIIGSKRYSLAEARALLDTALLLHGHVAVPMPGGGRKVVPIGGAALPWVEELAADPDDAPVTTLVRLEQIDAEFMLNAIQPLIGTGTIAVVEPSSNGILLAGSGRVVGRLRDAMGLLDDAGSVTQVIWSLEHRQAAEVVALLEDAFPDDLLHPQIDERTNRLVLGVRAERLKDMRRFVSRIDRPPVGRGELHVLRVRNADAEAMAQHINELKGAGSEVAARGALLSNRDFAIEVDVGTSSLVVRADSVTAQIISDLVAELDVHPPRVRIHLNVVEVVSSESLTLGFDSFVPLSRPKNENDTIAVIATNPSRGGLPSFAGPGRSFVTRFAATPFDLPITGPDGNPIEVSRGSFAISGDQGMFESRMLMSPELLVASGEEQELFVGNNIPLLTSDTTTSETSLSSALETRQSVERHDTGVLARVTPTVGVEGGVRLELLVEVSALSRSVADVERVGPVLAERSIEAVVHLYSDATAVLAFAVQPIEMQTFSGVPYLSRIPLLGALFRTTSESSVVSTLIATVRAVIERDEARVLTAVLEEHLAALRAADAPAPAAPVDG